MARLLLLRLTFLAKVAHGPEHIAVIEPPTVQSPFNRPIRAATHTLDYLRTNTIDIKSHVILTTDPRVMALSEYTTVITTDMLDLLPVSKAKLRRDTGFDPRDIEYFDGIDNVDTALKRKAGNTRRERWGWVDTANGAPVYDVDNIHIKVGQTGFENYEICQDLPALLRALDHVDRVGWDTETTGLDPRTDTIVGDSVSIDGEHGWYVPSMHIEGRYRNIPPAQVEAQLRPVLERKQIAGANLSFDVSMAHSAQAFTPTNLEDVQGYAYMLGMHVPDPSKLGLKKLSWDILGQRMEDFDSVSKGKEHFGMVPIERAAPYAADDAVKSLKLADTLRARLDEQQRERFDSVEMPFLYCCIRMSRNGMYLDQETWPDLVRMFENDLENTRGMIHALAGRQFDVGSSKQLQRILFDKLQLRSVKRTKTGASTARASLEAIANDHPIVEYVLKYRELDKLLNTYLHPFPLAVDNNGRVHSNLNPFRVITGRIASNNPNILNIPIRTELGRKIRAAFIAQGDNMLLSSDAAQLEYRILAHATGNPRLVEAFRDPTRDIHREMASIIFEIDVVEVTSAQRDKAKTVIYAILYGAQVPKIAATLNVSMSEAARIMKAINERIPELPILRDTIVTEARRRGYVTSVGGHRAYIWGIRAAEKGRREAAERTAFDSYFQSTASGDITKLATIDLQRQLDEGFNDEIMMVIQAHDEIVFEGPEEALREFGPRVNSAFENALTLDVPIVADFSVGKRWSEVH